MVILDYFLNRPPINSNFYNRKLKLPKELSFNLYGAVGVGKSALIVDYLKDLPKYSYLYIDTFDPQFILEELDTISLEYFIKQEGIKTLIIDHYIDGILDYIPKVEQLIIVTREPSNLLDNRYKLYPLDFEEFFSFSKSSSIEVAFSNYIKSGSLPSIALKGIDTFAPKELFFEKFDIQIGKVLLILSLYQCKVTTSHQVYQMAKEKNLKLSKDWLYMAIKKLIKEGTIYQIETLEKSLGKKIIFYDFALAKYLNKNLNYLLTFDALIAIALIKQNIDIKAVLNPVGYYILKNKELIVVAPFEDDESMWQKVQKNFGLYSKIKPSIVTIITNSNRYEFTINNIKFNALPFFEWVTGLE